MPVDNKSSWLSLVMILGVIDPSIYESFEVSGRDANLFSSALGRWLEVTARTDVVEYPNQRSEKFKLHILPKSGNSHY